MCLFTLYTLNIFTLHSERLWISTTVTAVTSFYSLLHSLSHRQRAVHVRLALTHLHRLAQPFFTRTMNEFSADFRYLWQRHPHRSPLIIFLNPSPLRRSNRLWLSLKGFTPNMDSLQNSTLHLQTESIRSW